MSKMIFRQDGLAVADDVLPTKVFLSLRQELSRADYKSVHTQKWDKAWRLSDGFPLRGESVYFDPKKVFGWKGASYPTSRSVDSLIDAVLTMSASCPEVAGVREVDWVAIYLSPWLYPVGSSLSQHRDAQRFSGSFAFFTHARWNMHWGGELLVSRKSAATSVLSAAHPSFPPDPLISTHEERWMSEDAIEDGDDSGIATCVSPKPNRLVLISPDLPHRVTRVDQNAGAHVRASIAGFFMRSP